MSAWVTMPLLNSALHHHKKWMTPKSASRSLSCGENALQSPFLVQLRYTCCAVAKLFLLLHDHCTFQKLTCKYLNMYLPLSVRIWLFIITLLKRLFIIDCFENIRQKQERKTFSWEFSEVREREVLHWGITLSQAKMHCKYAVKVIICSFSPSKS